MKQPMILQIMLVDDDRAILSVIGSALERTGIEVIRAKEGPAALALLDQVVPNLFVLDMMMPGMNGAELCRHLRARPETADVPVLVLSAWGDMRIMAQALEAGANDYVVKPVDIQELETKVGNLIGKA
jgi:two-component system phosphate regulon response regulator PhoB